MRKSITLLIALLASMALLTACANGGWSEGDTGTVLGGAAGAAVGHQIGGGTGNTLATVAGAIVGSMLGRRLGNNMSRNDRQRFGNTLSNTPAGQTRSWSNNESNDRYSVTPTSKPYSRNDRTCRQFRMKAEVGGQPDHVTGTACRQPNGSWVVQQ